MNLNNIIRLNKSNYTVIVLVIIIFLINIKLLFATPIGPSIIYNSSETAPPASAAMINTSGGSITTMVLDATTQNVRWKAYVGNVTGKLTLDDANNFTIFDWSMSNVVGEIYATRSSESVSWADINCSNSTHIYNEEIALNHTNNPDDNISTTFNVKDHDSFYVGTVLIAQDSCNSIHTFVNDSNQSTDFEEVLLYDGTNATNGDIIYATILEQNKPGFDNTTYDFQMIVPENGLSTWTSSTAYYFYVELT
jgi:hypothetical protein